MKNAGEFGIRVALPAQKIPPRWGEARIRGRQPSDDKPPFYPPLQGGVPSPHILPWVSPRAILFGSLREQPDGSCGGGPMVLRMKPASGEKASISESLRLGHRILFGHWTREMRGVELDQLHISR